MSVSFFFSAGCPFYLHPAAMGKSWLSFRFSWLLEYNKGSQRKKKKERKKIIDNGLLPSSGGQLSELLHGCRC